jgi:hypothetical protein
VQEWIHKIAGKSLLLCEIFLNSYIILLLHVDDMFVVGSSIEGINKLKSNILSKQFKIKDLEVVK